MATDGSATTSASASVYPRAIDRSVALPRARVSASFDLVYPAVLVLAAILPFEIIRPLIVTPLLSLTDQKLALVVLALAWLALGPKALPSPTEWRVIVPSLVLTGIALVSALAAPDYNDDALRVVWRFAVAAFVALATFRMGAIGKTRNVLWALVIGAGVSALFGLAEATAWRALDPLFALFKVAPTRVGSEIRISGSFQYATIASMYFEMAVPLALALAITTLDRRARWFATLIAIMCAANVALSLTRAGILTLMVVLVAMLIVSRRRAPIAATAATLLLLIGVLARTNPAFDMRLTTESDADWYGAAYAAPAALTLEPNQTASVDLDVRNEGRIVWSSSDKRHPFALGYRWLTADGEGVLDVPPGEVTLPRDVPPGDTVRLTASIPVPALPAGSYRLDWGMLQRDVVQFYERGWADASTDVQVLPGTAPSVAPGVRPRDDEEAPWVVGRIDLWTAGLRLALQRPLLGFGPDNFRHFYGAQLGLDSWDERVQANNVYLELLVDLGIVGLAAFLWQVLPITLRALRSRNLVTVGLGLTVVAFLVHGLLDSFLTFTPTALLCWMSLGLAAAATQKPQVSGR